jgi:MoaA/NifB/PqqE/SkfB family radical SAM enzyme
MSLIGGGRQLVKFFRATGRYKLNYLRRARAAAVAWLLPLSESDGSILGRSRSIVARAIALGRQGRLRLAPEHISISATEACNLECVMCPGHAGKHGPRLSLEQAEALFKGLTDEQVNFGRPEILDMTAGEPTLNQDLGPIYRRFKKRFPHAKITMISNATVPVRGRIREAFELTDSVGLSMDGATQETYEHIRKGSVFRNVVRNVRDVAKIKKEGINCEALVIMFVAMDRNIHELPELVQFAHGVGIPRVFAQESEVRTTPFNTEDENISLTMPDDEIRKFIAEAQSEADRLGVRLSLTSKLQDALRVKQGSSDKSGAGPTTLREGIPTCHYAWFYAPRIVQDGRGNVYPRVVCCHMPHASEGGDFAGQDDLRQQSIVDIFNSEHYWSIRAGILDGSLASAACRGCQYYRMTQWTPEQLRRLEAAIKRAGG